MLKMIRQEVTMNNQSRIPSNLKFMTRKLLFTSLAVTCFITTSWSQQGNLGDEQINVVKAYQPTLSDAFKISDVPERDTAVGYTPDMKYSVSQIQYQTVYTISPIKPLKIKDENIKKLYRGFIKAGYGTKNTPYGEIFYNSLRSKSADAGIHLSHISSSGDIKEYGFPGMSESGVKVFGTKFFDNNLLRGEIGYNRLQYHYYGYNDPPDIFSKSQTKHAFDDVFGNFIFKSSDKDADDLRYTGGISFYNFTDNRDNDESDFIFDACIGKKINDFDLGADVKVDFLRYENNSYGSDSRGIIRVNPRFVKVFDRLKLTAGANVPIEINDITKYHLYPHVRVDYTLIQDVMTAFGQLTGNLERNSFRMFSKENPFIGMDFRLENTNNKLDISGGFNVKLDRQLAFIGSIAFRRLTNDAFYYNLPASSTLVVYDVLYEDNSQTNIHAEIIFDQGEKTSWSVAADYFANNLSGDAKPLFRPDFKFTLNGSYTMADKIYLTTQWSYVTSRYAINYEATGGAYTTLKGYIDANLGVEYKYTKVMSFFANLNNFTASKYSRWYNYPSYRFGAMAGLTYSF